MTTDRAEGERKKREGGQGEVDWLELNPVQSDQRHFTSVPRPYCDLNMTIVTVWVKGEFPY